MAEFCAINVRTKFAGVDLSTRCRGLNFSINRDMPEATTFGDLWRRFLAGLKDLTTSANFNADYATGMVDDVLYDPLVDGTSIALAFLPNSLAAIGADNPEYQTTQFVENYTVLNVTPGAIASNDVSFKNASGTVVRDIVP